MMSFNCSLPLTVLWVKYPSPYECTHSVIQHILTSPNTETEWIIGKRRTSFFNRAGMAEHNYILYQWYKYLVTYAWGGGGTHVFFTVLLAFWKLLQRKAQTYINMIWNEILLTWCSAKRSRLQLNEMWSHDNIVVSLLVSSLWLVKVRWWDMVHCLCGNHTAEI